MSSTIPVALFAYNRPDHLRRALSCLRDENTPLLYAFADGPKTLEVEPRVRATREILRQVDWCEIHIVEKDENLGLGASILGGVGEVLKKHDAVIVVEDDLIFSQGAYRYLSAALERYKDDHRVMSVTGWTHPRVTPSDVVDRPYFDGRTESWSWGTWARVWKDMDQDAMTLMNSCSEKNIDIYRYGADLPEMARAEKKKNIWAVRFSYLHILHGGLCLRPPYSMVNHAGFDEQGTNATGSSKWDLETLKDSPPIPLSWPDTVEHPQCPSLWQKECGVRPAKTPTIIFKYLKRLFRKMEKVVTNIGK